MTTHDPPPLFNPAATLLIVPMKKQPSRIISDWTKDAEINEWVIYRDWPHRLLESSGCDKRAAGILTPRKIPCPFTSGDKIGVREEWCKCDVSDGVCTVVASVNYSYGVQYRADFVGMDDDIRWLSANAMPSQAIRKYSTVTAVSVGLAGKLSSSEAYDTGARCDCTSPVPICAGNIDAFRELFATAYPAHADNFDETWIWKLTMEVQDGK